MTFDKCAAAYIEAHKASWKKGKHAEQWRGSLRNYASPVFGSSPVQAIDLGLVMKALEPVWRTKSETASRVRGRIEAVLDWATVRGYRKGENPARWRGHLDKLLPARSKIQKVEHHPALPYHEIAEFTAVLRGQEGIGARALEFLILTAARTGEIIGARWDEVDFEEKIWVVPAARMKAGREHRVPLTGTALAILKQMNGIREGDFVFPGGKKTRPLSNMAMLAVLKRMGRSDLTAHGFRSTFRDWAAERTNFPREVVEMALAHTIESKVEAAYRRGDLFQKRRQLMEAWARFCDIEGRGGQSHRDQQPFGEDRGPTIAAKGCIEPEPSCLMPVAVLRYRGLRRTVGIPLRGFSRPMLSQWLVGFCRSASSISVSNGGCLAGRLGRWFSTVTKPLRAPSTSLRLSA